MLQFGLYSRRHVEDRLKSRLYHRKHVGDRLKYGLFKGKACGDRSKSGFYYKNNAGTGYNLDSNRESMLGDVTIWTLLDNAC
jgi:hypothetical protein